MTSERGCGRRIAGGLYAALPLGPQGRPVEDFIQCPPRRLGFDMPMQGQLPVMMDDTLHLADWIGSAFYPNVADFLEEVRAMGLSRRLSPSLAVHDPQMGCAPLEALSARSRLLCVHPRAFIYNVEDYQPADFPCPRNVEGHPGNAMCAGYYWWDVDDGEPIETFYPSDYDITVTPTRHDLMVRRALPSFSYIARRRPDGVTTVYAPAIFAAFPISSLVLIQGQHGEHVEMLNRLNALKLSVRVLLEDE